MPIIGNVGRKSFRVRMLNVSIHLALCLGAVTMIYPFLIMISSSLKSRVDSSVFNVVPRYLYDDDTLFRKYVESRYNEKTGSLNAAYECRFLSFKDVNLPVEERKPAVLDWIEFIDDPARSPSIFDYYVAEQTSYGINSRKSRAFRDVVKQECHGSLAELNVKYNMAAASWEEIKIDENGIASRNFTGRYQGILARYKEFKLSLPNWERVYINLDGSFIESEMRPAYGGDLEALNRVLGTNFSSWDRITLACTKPEGLLGEHWGRFVKEYLSRHYIRIRPEGKTPYRSFLKEKYDSIEMLNRTYGAQYKNFAEIELPVVFTGGGVEAVDLDCFIKNSASPDMLELKGYAFEYRAWLKNKYKTASTLDQAYGNGFSGFEKIALSASASEINVQERKVWFQFLLHQAAPQSLRLHQSAAQKAFFDYLSERFPSEDEDVRFDLEKLNKAYGTSYENELDVYPAASLPEERVYRKDWLEFLRTKTMPAFLEIDSKQEMSAWQSHLKTMYLDIATLNRAWGLTHDSFATVNLPFWSVDAYQFRQHKSEIFWEFVTRNYLMVLDVMLYNGSAILNTLIYCALAIMTALTVNPLAAYAMSRYKLPTTYKIILVLMLTMAFPPMVMGIPNFLLLKKIGLLNTFAALILPGMADGYFIFLLKGFFDSLPQELFESATIDGASECQIFWNVAMALSKPIMAVIALGAFNAAYRNFMMAFIVCQDDRMWTLMVHIYQLMQRSSVGVGFAALVVAAVPTFLVFIFCQNIIIRGIVIPTEK